MTTQEMLFSFKGRIGRLSFLKYWLLLCIAGIASAYAFPNASANIVFNLIWLLLLWQNLAIYVKRLHDRNRSIIFGLLIFIPVVGLWALVETFALKGTDGPNNYGPAP